MFFLNLNSVENEIGLAYNRTDQMTKPDVLGHHILQSVEPDSDTSMSVDR